MRTKKAILLPRIRRVLEELGTNIKLARLRRRLSTTQVSERANITRMTLLAIEKGSPSVKMGSYVLVLFVLGMEKDLLKVATDDLLGQKLMDAKILTKKRAPKRPVAS